MPLAYVNNISQVNLQCNVVQNWKINKLWHSESYWFGYMN